LAERATHPNSTASITATADTTVSSPGIIYDSQIKVEIKISCHTGDNALFC
jgi:hypothetical protein